ncbi:hypothetical protein PENSPDRAFT_683474 [Peniophora sp. CONT]|nr:hypothetical protein PENSPDRAFT_683474 [Peniophora sp. CONT]
MALDNPRTMVYRWGGLTVAATVVFYAVKHNINSRRKAVPSARREAGVTLKSSTSPAQVSHVDSASRNKSP